MGSLPAGRQGEVGVKKPLKKRFNPFTLPWPLPSREGKVID